MKFAPGAVEAARVFLFLLLLLRGMMKICLWLLVSVMVVVVSCWLKVVVVVGGERLTRRGQRHAKQKIMATIRRGSNNARPAGLYPRMS